VATQSKQKVMKGYIANKFRKKTAIFGSFGDMEKNKVYRFKLKLRGRLK
jgi:hypothetical protein